LRYARENTLKISIFERYDAVERAGKRGEEKEEECEGKVVN